MQFKAKSRYLNYSPYKLRPIVDIIRGKDAQYALAWLSTYAARRRDPIQKVLASAVANAQQKDTALQAVSLLVKDIRVDQGPIVRYFRPGARGAAQPQRRRYSHISVVLEAKAEKSVVKEKKVKKSVAKKKEA